MAVKFVYFGFNGFNIHKRGVENVIHFQSYSSPNKYNYYIYWDLSTTVKRNNNFICIGIKKNILCYLILNFVLIKMKKNGNILFIHSHNPLMSIFCVFQSNLFTVHDGLYYLAKSYKKKYLFLYDLLERLLYYRCGFVHFISEYTKKNTLYRFKNNFCIIPNTSHFEKFHFNYIPEKTNYIKFSKSVYKILIVRSIEERALVDLIINTAEVLQHENYQFLIAGKGPLLDQKQQTIKSRNLTNISLLGYVSDENLINLYQNCDLVLVTAAYGEGFGLPIIEAYLFNKPAIASNVCAIPEVIVSEDFLFENEVKSVISKIRYARECNKINYHNYYMHRFSNKTIVSNFMKLYKELS
jgi:glycosyltransferase involved in cell wall biosynthesis